MRRVTSKQTDRHTGTQAGNGNIREASKETGTRIVLKKRKDLVSMAERTKRKIPVSERQTETERKKGRVQGVERLVYTYTQKSIYIYTLNIYIYIYKEREREREREREGERVFRELND